ncbi:MULTISPECIES: FAD-binding oxidoreductase [unclassified Streptomyces]|uniref:FAD-binding oxidoreductase n=1 Tax=unclassified Streptomyces TaxID=2593676 RepID=UPI00369BF1CC
MSRTAQEALRVALWPGDPGYDEARRVWNGMIDRRPAVIVPCSDATDVAAAVRYATAEGLAVTVRGGGHNVAGLALADDALLIDLGPMRHVDVDPAGRTAVAGGGALLADLDGATLPHGLACPVGVVSETGLGGLALGGGYGWLARKWGLTCDHLIAAEVVLADGSIVRASAENQPELFWGLRGGGGNFGVVTRFTLRLRPVDDVWIRSAVYPIEQAAAAVRAYRDAMPSQPDDLQLVGAFKRAPAADWIPEHLHGEPVLAFTTVWLGTEGGPEAAAGLFADCPPAGSIDRIIPFADLQSMGDGSEPAGRRYYTTSGYLADLPSDAVDVLVRYAVDGLTTYSTIDLGYFRGAVARVDDDTTAFPSRDASFICSASAAWDDPAGDDHGRSWAGGLIRDLGPWRSEGSYVNYTQRSGRSAADVYGAHRYARLAALKAQVDPTNVFRGNHNISPSPTRA